MVIIMNRIDGNEAASFSCELRFNVFTGDVEFTTKGSTSQYTKTLIQRPYLERWYHVAVTRSGSSFAAYVDGCPVTHLPESGSTSVGSATGSGLAIGGINGNSRLFLGDIIEVAVYQKRLEPTDVRSRMSQDQHTADKLKGHYKLAYSTNSADFYRNFVSSPPSGTDPAVKVGSGDVQFEEVDQAGEQSLFDSRKNRGDGALVPLSAAFDWQQVAFARPTPGVAFDFRYGYMSR